MPITTNPINSWFTTPRKSTCLVLLTDDTEDHPSDKQQSKDQDIYYSWHSIIMPAWIISSVENEWCKIKLRNNISDKYLHCTHTDHNNILMNPHCTMRNDIHNMLISHNLIQYFSTRKLSLIKKFSHAYADDEKYCLMKKQWSLDDPKEQTLFFHLINLDRRLQDEYYRPEGVVFCDRTARSDTTFKNRITSDAAWGYRKHYDLNNIHQNIQFRLLDKPVDVVGRCLDLADYCSWTTQRVFRLVRARDFVELTKLSPKEWNQRLDDLSISDQELCNQLLQRVHEGKLQIL